MKGTIITLPVEGDLQIREIDGEPTWQLLKEAIGGGYIEEVPRFDRFKFNGETRRCVVFCDEEGKLKSFPPNIRATAHWELNLAAQGETLRDSNGDYRDFLCGDVAIVFGDREFMEAL